MGVSISRGWLVVSLMAVVLPLSVLVTLRLTGILTGILPGPLETITVEPVHWQMDRPKLDPGQSFHIDETIQNGYSDNYTSIEISVHIMHYVEDWLWVPFGNDGMAFKVNYTATLAEGLKASFAVKFRTVDNYSTVYVSRQYLVAYNTTVTEMRLVSREWRKEGWHNLGEAYVKAESTGSRCTLGDQIEWVFTDLNVEDHQLEVILEFTYFSQIATQKIAVPIILGMPISTYTD